MKKIIGFFKVLFHLKSIIDEIKKQISTNEIASFEEYTNINAKLLYLTKFAVYLKKEPLYEIGQTVFCNLNESAEKGNNENKLQGKVLGIIVTGEYDISKYGILIPEYEYVYQLKLTNGYIEVPESKIIM